MVPNCNLVSGFEMKATRLLLLALVIPCATMCASPKVHGQDQTSVPQVEEIIYGHKDGLALTLDWHKAESRNRGAVLFMVSGGWVSRWAPPEQIRPLFAPYLLAGFDVFAVRHGSSPRYGIPDALQDVRRAVRFVRANADRFDVDGDRLGVLGMSAGGHLSLMLGTTGDDGNSSASDPLERVSSRVAAVVALVPPTDLRVAVWESPESLPAYRNFPALDMPLSEAGEYSPLVHVTADDAPSLVIMGGKDELVPPKHGHWIDDAMNEADVEHKLVVFEDAGHSLEGIFTRNRMYEESVAWFKKHLTAND